LDDDKQKIIILDRDGVINHDSDDFIKSPAEWLPIPGSLEAIGDLCAAGYKVYVLTNQSGIARAYFSLDTLKQIHAKMHSLVEAKGGKIHGVFYCPHGPDDNCDCRKPKAGLYQQLQQQNPEIISFAGIDSIGDSIRDLQAAKTAGANPVLIRTGKGVKSEQTLQQNDLAATPVFDSLAAYTEFLLQSTNLQ